MSTSVTLTFVGRDRGMLGVKQTEMVPASPACSRRLRVENSGGGGERVPVVTVEVKERWALSGRQGRR